MITIEQIELALQYGSNREAAFETYCATLKPNDLASLMLDTSSDKDLRIKLEKLGVDLAKPLCILEAERTLAKEIYYGTNQPGRYIEIDFINPPSDHDKLLSVLQQTEFDSSLSNGIFVYLQALGSNVEALFKAQIKEVKKHIN